MLVYEYGQQFKNKDGRIATIEKIRGVKFLVLRQENNEIEKTWTIRKIDIKVWEEIK